MYKIINTLFTLLLILPVMGQTSDLNNSFRITANREDGRFSSSRGAVQYMLKQKPAFTFNPA
ncbi:alpha/beta hydrolase family protein, partial [Parabacteroides merdae]